MQENAALCDQVAEVQESIVNVKDERRFLLKRLMDLDKNLAVELAKRQKQNGTTQTRRPYKKRAKKNANNPPDADGNAIDSKGDLSTFPLDLDTLQILSIGQLITDRVNYHGEHFIYPSGYVATRNFAHIRNKDEKCTYTCRIIENGDYPRFEIIPADDADSIIAGPTPDLCHAALIQTINENTEQNNELSAQGEWFFGLTHPTVKQMLENLPNLEKCIKFKGFIGNASTDGSTTVSSWNFGASTKDMTMSSYDTVLEIKEEPPDELF